MLHFRKKNENKSNHSCLVSAFGYNRSKVGSTHGYQTYFSWVGHLIIFIFCSLLLAVDLLLMYLDGSIGIRNVTANGLFDCIACNMYYTDGIDMMVKPVLVEEITCQTLVVVL